MEAAAAIEERREGTKVVFVTAYSSYALSAFEVNALDYVLKPIDPVRFAKAMTRVRETFAAVPRLQRGDAGAAVQTFGQLAVLSSAPGEPAKWRTLKSKELFAYLLQYRERWLTRDLLLEELWPSYENDKALVHLHTAVYQVRRALKALDPGAALEYSLESYRLSGERLVTDADLFEREADKAFAGERTDEAYEAAVKCWSLYRGHYLDREGYGWARARTERLHQAYVELTVRLVRHELKAGKSGMALRRARRSGELSPFSEQLALAELACLRESGEPAAMKRKYETFCTHLENELGAAPSDAFKMKYAELAGYA
ncbi:BTAD domain-containing putative transcriptional regulator [Cohnella rhizosphaerae]|uniref:Two-component system response regulator n=1 Tax=Cohnella rhizosphaerae TaxID=1457232 RepID=A0A9X4L0T6_9BACL|nr:BTAD domain-containing putative transcriptional regulator [Cohnella rhizosphaerae]MDG0814458.1 two-component system response regulator [Cohnella rhizosphaerae]